jgi:hypothetical protein
MLKGRPPVRVEMRRRFWRQVGLGASTAVAAAAAGVSEQTGGRWFVEAGGMPPIKLAEPSGRYLSFVEREEIAVLVAQRVSIREIARRIGRRASTVSRELGRNTPRYGAARGGRLRLDLYRASSASSARRPPRPGRGAPSRPSWPPTGGCATTCRTSWTPRTGGARNRSPPGCRSSSPTMSRCGCPTRPSTSPCTCRAGARSAGN